MIRSLLLWFIMFLACLVTVFLTLIDGVCSLPFLKQPWKTHHVHISGWQSQDSSGSNCERMVIRELVESFSHMNWHLWVQTLNSLKVFGVCWSRLYRVYNSCIVNTRKLMHLLIRNTCCFFHQEVHPFLVKILYWQWKGHALYK